MNVAADWTLGWTLYKFRAGLGQMQAESVKLCTHVFFGRTGPPVKGISVTRKCALLWGRNGCRVGIKRACVHQLSPL